MNEDLPQKYDFSGQTLTLANALNEQRTEEKFCDVVLLAGGKKFPVHK